MHMAKRLILAFLLAGLWGATAQAQVAYQQFLHPQRPSRNDAVYVSYGLTCGHPIPDSAHPPQVLRTITETQLDVRVDMFLMRNPGQICTATPPGPTFALVDVGAIPENVAYVRATRRVWLVDGATRSPINVAQDVVAMYEVPGNGISGDWWSPQVPGTLTNLLLANHPGSAYGELILTTQQFDVDDRPVSITAVGTFDGPTFEAPALVPARSAPGAPEVQARTIGTLRLTYDGCHNATLELESSSAAFASFEHAIEQISWPKGEPGCSLNPSFVLPAITVDAAH